MEIIFNSLDCFDVFCALSGMVNEPHLLFFFFGLMNTDKLMGNMCDCVAANVREREAHDLMRVFHFSKDEMMALEKEHRTAPPEALTQKVLSIWRERRGRSATPDELIRYLKLIDMEAVSRKLTAIKVYSEVHRM